VKESCFCFRSWQGGKNSCSIPADISLVSWALIHSLTVLQVGLLGRGISVPQAATYTRNNTNRINAHRHPCLESDSNLLLQCSSDWRPRGNCDRPREYYTISWDVTPCSQLEVNRRFGGTCPNFQGRIWRRHFYCLHPVAWVQLIQIPPLMQLRSINLCSTTCFDPYRAILRH
jgi:hypothetical protein